MHLPVFSLLHLLVSDPQSLRIHKGKPVLLLIQLHLELQGFLGNSILSFTFLPSLSFKQWYTYPDFVKQHAYSLTPPLARGMVTLTVYMLFRGKM